MILPRLRTVAFDDVPIRTEYVLAYLHERRNSHLISAFCDVALSEDAVRNIPTDCSTALWTILVRVGRREHS